MTLYRSLRWFWNCLELRFWYPRQSSVYPRLRKDHKNIRLDLAQGIALALEFKMGGEVLRTVVVREWSELGILGAIIVLRAMLTFLIHWEIENEKKEAREEQQ